MSVVVSYKKQFIFGVMLLLVLLTIVELGIRTYEYQNPLCSFLSSEVYDDIQYEQKKQICDDRSKLSWSLDSNQNMLLLEPNQKFDTLNINNDGFRDLEIPSNKNENLFRIFVVGGSTTFGTGSISDDTTIPNFLEKKLIDNYPELSVEVINAGIPAFTSTEEYKLIKQKIITLEPDMIIGYDGLNDLKYPLNNDPSSKFLQLELSNFYNKYFSFYRTISFVYNIGTQHLIDSEKKSFNAEFLSQKVDRWEQNWIKICTLGDEYGFTTISTLQPILGTGTKILTLEEQSIFLEYDHDNALQGYELFGERISNLDQICTASLDLRNSLDNETGSIYFDDGHMGSNGNKIIADKIFENIIAYMP